MPSTSALSARECAVRRWRTKLSRRLYTWPDLAFVQPSTRHRKASPRECATLWWRLNSLRVAKEEGQRSQGSLSSWAILWVLGISC